MPRFRRVHSPHVVHHVICRFVNGEYRLRDAFERREYLRRVGAAATRNGWRLLAFALMSTHIHLCAIAGLSPLAAWLSPAHSPFAPWLNRRQGRRGPLFAERPTTILFEPEDTLRLIAYIHNNPVRAGCIETAVESTWTSHRIYMGLETCPSWLHINTGLRLCGSTPEDLDAHARAHACDPRDDWFSATDRTRIRAGVRTIGPVDLSDPEAQANGLRYGIEARPGTPVRRAEPPIAAPELAEYIAERAGLPSHLARSRAKTPEAVRARRLAVLVWRALGGPSVEIASALGIGSSAAAQLVNRRPELAAQLAGEVDHVVGRIEGATSKAG